MESGKRFKCTYEYSGMETEGHVYTEPEYIIEAEDKAEALYKYHQWIYDRSNKIYKPMSEWYPTLEDYRKSEYCEGGWGYWAEELKDGE